MEASQTSSPIKGAIMQRTQTLQGLAPYIWRLAIMLTVAVIGYLIVSAFGYLLFTYGIWAGG
ncbi:MAG: hypothetical protein CL694_13135 [Chloroflexi bacterium]|nr:hypothetical protein [Chloroflexota bacterium]